MADYVTIANLALSLLGENDQLRDPDQDGHAARSVRAVWWQVRRAVLRDHPWNFAMARHMLPASATIVPIGWDRAFPLPDNCVRLVEILSPAISVADYALEGGAILCDAPGPLGVRCVMDVEETSRWDDLFVDAFAAKLAWQIADRITGDRGRRQDMERAYMAALNRAKGVDAKENPPIEAEDGSWITARWGD